MASAFESAGLTAPEAEDREGTAGALAVTEVAPPAVEVGSEFQVLAESVVRLSQLQDEVFGGIYTPDSFRKAQLAPDIRGKIAAYLATMPVFEKTPGAASFVYLSLSRALAVYAGFDSRADAVPTLGAYQSYLEAYEQGEPLPAEVSRQIDVVVPALVAAMAQEARHSGLEGQALLDQVTARFPIVEKNMVTYASRIHGEGNYLRFFSPDRAARFLRDPEVFEEIFKRVLEGNSQVPEKTEMFLLSRALDASVRTFGQRPVAFSQRFKDYPEVESSEALAEGLDAPAKKTLPDGTFYFNPVFFFRNSLTLVQRGDISPVGMFYGFDPEMMNKLRKLVMGESALVDFDAEAVNSLFRESLATGTPFTVPPRGAKESVFGLIRKSLVDPAEGGRPDTTAYSLVLSKTLGKDFQIGPKAALTVLSALGALEVGTPAAMLDHARRLGVSDYAQDEAHVRILRDPSRKLMLQRLGYNSFGRYLMSDVVPLVRVPAPNRIQGMDAVQDAFHKTLVSLVNAVDALSSNPESPEYQVRLQILMGYYFLGEKVYDGLRLPYSRLDKAPARGLPGLLPSLEAKEGEYRLFYMGGRLPYSSRMVATADVNLPFGVVGVPPTTMATLRGHLLNEHLRRVGQQMDGQQLDQVVKANFLATVFASFDVNCPGANLLSELQRRMERLRVSLKEQGAEYEESFKRVTAQFSRHFPADQAGDFRYICGDATVKALGYSSRAFLSRLAWQCLTDPMVSGYLKDLNHEWPMVFSRYPRLHAQSFVSVRTVVNAPDDETIRSHPLQAKVLNLDYDGDCNELMAQRTLNPKLKPLLERHSSDVAIFDAGRMSSLAFGLDLNSLEGLIKGNMHFHPVGGAMNQEILGEDIDEVFDASLPSREDLLRRCGEDPNALVTLYLGALRALKAHLQSDDDPSTLGDLLVVNPANKTETTTVTRAFFHKVTQRILGPESTVAALDRYYLPAGLKAVTKPEVLQSELVANLAGSVGDRPALPGVFSGFYNLGADLAVRQTGSNSVKGLEVSEQLLYCRNDAVVVALREAFRQRASALELATSRNFMTRDALMTSLLRLEHGGGADLGGKSWQKEFAQLHKIYVESKPEGREAAYAAVKDYLLGCLAKPDVGLKPLLKAAVQLSTDRYQFEYGVPHIWSEQLLSGSIKAKEEVLAISSLGIVNQIDGQATPTTFDDLLGGLSVDGFATAAIPTLDRSVKSKTEVPVSGELLKDLEAMMRNVKVGASRESSDTVGLSLEEYFQGEPEGYALNLGLLAEQTKGRKVYLQSAVMPAEELLALNTRLSELTFQVPFDGKAVGRVFAEAYAKDPKAEARMASVLADKNFPEVAPESVGVHPMEGLRLVVGRAQRTPLAAMPHRGLPIGSIMAGAIGEDGTQGALASRHTSGSTQAVYTSLADFWKMKFGPFPQRSPYFRAGAERLVSENPLSYEGLSGYTSAFATKVKVPDSDLVVAKAATDVGGVQVFPGEAYFVRNGRLVVGTNRPEKMHFALKAGVETSPAVDRVEPSKLLLTVSSEAYAKLFGAASNVVDFSDGEVGSHKISGFRAGGAFKVVVPASGYAAVVSQTGAPVGVEPAEGSVLRPVVGEPQGVLFYRVRDASAFAKDNGMYVPAGSVLNPMTGLAVASTKAMTRETTQGFMVFLDYVKDRPLSPYAATLAPDSGVVQQVRPLGVQGDMEVFELGFKADGGADHKLIVELPKGHFPNVQEGQRLDAGDPVTFGHVSMTDRAPLRPKFREELARYAFSFYYKAGKDSMWSSNTEMMARCLVQPTAEGRDRFVSIGKAYQSDSEPRLLQSREAASRLGDLDHLVSDVFLGGGIVSERTLAPVFTPDELAAQRGHTLLDSSLHPVHETDKSYVFLPESLMSSGKRAVRERLSAVGLDV